MFFNMGGMPHMGGGHDGPVDTKLYDVLGVSPNASDDDIKKAYRRLAKEYHPDKNSDHGDKFKEISFANEILSNPEKRRMYDQVGLEGIQEGGGGGGGFPSDLFSQLFEGDHQFPFFNNARRKKPAKPIVHQLVTTLEEVYKGKTAKLQITRYELCATCKGSGGRPGVTYDCQTCRNTGIETSMRPIGPNMMQQVQSPCRSCGGTGSRLPESEKCRGCEGTKSKKVQKVIEVHIDPGMRNGEQIPFRGEGDRTDASVPSGDLVVVVSVKDHPVFERFGDNLLIKKEISLNEALCGMEMSITHLDGRKVLLKTRRGDIITPGSTRGIKNEGMPRRRHNEVHGNLYVTFDVKFPSPHFLDSEKKYAMLAKCFANVSKVTCPPGGEEVSLFDYDEKKYGGRAREAYDDESDEDEGPSGHGPQVQCAQS